jgi:hypothetical protein
VLEIALGLDRLKQAIFLCMTEVIIIILHVNIHPHQQRMQFSTKLSDEIIIIFFICWASLANSDLKAVF